MAGWYRCLSGREAAGDAWDIVDGLSSSWCSVRVLQCTSDHALSGMIDEEEMG